MCFTVYDIVMQYKIARGEDSAEMFDIIVRSIIVDLGRVSGVSGYSDIFNQLMMQRSSDLTSRFERVEAAAMRHYGRILEGFLD